MGYQDKMILEEIASNDDDMVRDAIKNSNKYRFMKAGKAIQFIGFCLKASMEFIGYKNMQKMADIYEKATLAMIQHIIDPQIYQLTDEIRVEYRGNNQGNDMWRNGIYIYKDDVLVVFIGSIMKEVPHILLNYRADQQFGYIVVTNARVDPAQRIYTV